VGGASGFRVGRAFLAGRQQAAASNNAIPIAAIITGD